MKIEIGKKYRTYRGTIVEVIHKNRCVRHNKKFVAKTETGKLITYDSEGFRHLRVESDMNIEREVGAYD